LTKKSSTPCGGVDLRLEVPKTLITGPDVSERREYNAQGEEVVRICKKSKGTNDPDPPIKVLLVYFSLNLGSVLLFFCGDINTMRRIYFLPRRVRYVPLFCMTNSG